MSDKFMPRWLQYGAGFTLIWVILTQGDPGAWSVGIAFVPLATWVALRLYHLTSQAAGMEKGSLHPLAVLGFIPFFLFQSLKGGWDSARFAMAWHRSIQPGFLRYTTRLPPGPARIFFVNTISVLPGTINADCDGADLTIHALDTRLNHCLALQQCEEQVARLFGLPLTSGETS
ncbi:MAG: cation transporter [Kangiellaceae bacterium]|jgi:multicomponent Na+:H+ antiporter subunit E|nr:cation transporter [Kangiellaceae bacterium]|tara:strand:+ start:5805 stop:6326 length:522 start_codon:yes stop_codon:yes gene_type:complete